MKDFFMFRRMLLPYFVQILFWFGLIACVGTAIYDFTQGMFTVGLLALILGPIVVRLLSEFFILFFVMNDALFDIRKLLSAMHSKVLGQ